MSMRLSSLSTLLTINSLRSYLSNLIRSRRISSQIFRDIWRNTTRWREKIIYPIRLLR